MSESAAGAELEVLPRSFSRASIEFVGCDAGADDCLRPEPLGRREEARSETEESEETSESDEPLGECPPWRCDVT